MDLYSHKHDFVISIEWISPSDVIGGAVKTKCSQAKSLNYQILDYKAIIDLFENEMMSLNFFGICKESMISVQNLEIEKCYQGGGTVPATRSNHHLVPLSSSQIGI